MLKNIALAVLSFLIRMLDLLVLIAFAPILLPIGTYYKLRDEEYSRAVSIIASLAVFTVVSSLYFLAVIVPFFMPNLAIAASILDTSQILLISFPNLLNVLTVLLVRFFPPQSADFAYNNVPNEPFISPEPDKIKGMIQELAITKSSRNVLSDGELALIKTLLVTKTATDSQGQNRALLRSLSERYVALKEKIDAVERALIAGEVLENFDDFIVLSDVDTPILCAKEYEKEKDVWLAVPNMGYITDCDMINNWCNQQMTHPLNREPFLTPPPYVDNGVSYTTRYSLYELTEEHCWAAELDESALKIRELIQQLNSQPTPSAPSSIPATCCSFFSRLFGQTATATANKSASELDSIDSSTPKSTRSPY